MIEIKQRKLYRTDLKKKYLNIRWDARCKKYVNKIKYNQKSFYTLSQMLFAILLVMQIIKHTCAYNSTSCFISHPVYFLQLFFGSWKNKPKSFNVYFLDSQSVLYNFCEIVFHHHLSYWKHKYSEIEAYVYSKEL